MPTRRSTILWIIAIIAVSVAVYLPSMDGGFLNDDWALIVYDKKAHSLKNIPQAFTTDFLQGIIPGTLAYYRPLVTISYQINYAISGPSPAAFRLTNVLLSALAAMMLFLITRRLTKSTFAAGIAGLAFAVLPSHTESVAWISGRTDVLCAIFVMGSLMAFAANYTLRPRFNWRLALLGSFLFLCALLSKENALMLPGILLAYVWVYGERPRRSELLKWTLVLTLPVVVVILLRACVLDSSLYSGVWHMYKERVLCVGTAYAVYLRMMFVPQQVSVVYDVYPAALKHPVIAITAWLIPTGLVALSIRTRRNVPIVSFGALWILITLLPATNLLPTINPLPAERFVYLPSIGSSILLGWLAWNLYRLRPRSFQIWPAAAVCIICAYILYSAAWAMHGSQKYTSDLAWARAVTASNTRLPVLRASAAYKYADAGLFEEAVSEYEAVLAVRKNEAMDYIGLAKVWRQMREPQNAIEVLDRAREALGKNAAIEYEAGIAYAETGDMQNAEIAFKQAVKLNPKLAAAWRNLGKARLKQTKYASAAQAYKEALKLAQPRSEFAEKVREELRKASDQSSVISD